MRSIIQQQRNTSTSDHTLHSVVLQPQVINTVFSDEPLLFARGRARARAITMNQRCFGELHSGCEVMILTTVSTLIKLEAKSQSVSHNAIQLANV
jgi:hypothetical protein